MPELPEVETIRLGLERRIKGLEIKDIWTNQYGMLKGEPKNAIGARVKDIRRRAKILIIDLRSDYSSSASEKSEASSCPSLGNSNDNYSLVIHLKMTGQLVFQSFDQRVKVVGGHPQAEYNKPLPHAFTHIIITFADGSHLFFNDLRRFGWMVIKKTAEVGEIEGIKNAGVEPLPEGGIKNNESRIKGKIARTRKPIKTLLMDQTFIAGIGNIYSDEILYRAGIRPDRPAASLSEGEIDKLFRAIPEVLREALKRGGTSDSTYIGVDGERGDYLRVAAVYHKKQCPKGHPIETKKIGGRTAHFCPVEQK